jgi:hypothetical protein
VKERVDTTRLDCREIAGGHARCPVADPPHAGKLDEERAGADPPLDRLSRDPGLEQRSPGHDPVASSRHLGQNSLQLPI